VLLLFGLWLLEHKPFSSSEAVVAVCTSQMIATVLQILQSSTEIRTSTLHERNLQVTAQARIYPILTTFQNKKFRA
jgi:hypothetical protein